MLSFVDRDMFMRYRGGGPCHMITRHLNKELLADSHLRRPRRRVIMVEESDGDDHGDNDIEVEADAVMDLPPDAVIVENEEADEDPDTWVQDDSDVEFVDDTAQA